MTPIPFPQQPQSPTEWNIDQTLSLYIPFVADENATEDYIAGVFYNLNIGIVKRVDFQPHWSVYSTDSVGKSAFVHMERWFENVCVEHLHERIVDNIESKEARIVHDDPEYWVLKRNKNPIPDSYSENLATLQQSVAVLTGRTDYLAEKNATLEATIEQMWWWIRLHDANIRYLCDKVKPPPPPVQSTLVESSNPVNTEVDAGWGKRLRKRSYSTS